MSDVSQGPGWWQASDGKWYPPEQAPGGAPPGGYGQPGYAAPGYGAPYGPPGAYAPPGPLAEWGQRVVAYVIDVALLFAGYIAVWILALVFGAIADALGVLVALVGYLAMLGLGIYFVYLNGSVGQSPGKRLTGLKVVGERTGQPIGGGLGIVRGLAHIVDSLVCYLGWLWPLWDDRKQTLADKIMSTVVLTGQPKQQFGPDIFRP